MSFFLDAAPYLETAESGIKESGDDYVCTILQWDHDLQVSSCRTIRKARDIDTIQPASLTIILAPSDEAEEDRIIGFRTLVKKFQIPGSFLEERNQQVLNSFGYVEEDKTSTCDWLHFLLKRVDQEEGRPEEKRHNLGFFQRLLRQPKRLSNPAPRTGDQDIELDGHRIPFGQPEDDNTPYLPQWISSAASHQAGPNETPQCNVTLICFETSPEVQNELETLVRELKMKEILHHPSILWEIIMYHLSMALDAELWRLTEVFKTEQRTLGYLTARPSKALSEIDFSALHLLADHMVLILEGARGLLATIDGLIDHHESSIGSSPGFLARKTRDALNYRRRYVQSIVERGTTFDKRISNMISLFFSHVSLQDSGLMMRDSSSLRSIALITLIFLPITTVATICGSAFFYMAEHDDGSQSVQMDSSSWSMFFVSGMATIILIGIWTFQLQSLQRQFTRGRITSARNTGNVPLVV
ncbi:hypothetical protein EDB81DRAFT_659705 [Dactylonectria macrodidyma]|uniref:Uncharacterized protein n=1 Tax=Dactylonectria macrodidyma TaxID=307937 RepID=A0A9P9E7U8_9HYPO|nr:hypothetical protein EDB81DRAFT_659705 [Dactylonectria macrodidyma]